MRSHGIPGLLATGEVGAVSGAVSAPFANAHLLAEFGRWVPDESCHLVRLGALFSVSTVHDLANALHYNGPLELLSMWLCLFCGKGMVAEEVLGLRGSLDMAVTAACGARFRPATVNTIRFQAAACKLGGLACVY